MREHEGLYRAAQFIKRAVMGVIAMAVAVVAIGYLFLMRQVDRGSAWSEAARELSGNVLHYHEPVVRLARVYRRRPTNYFRAVNGLLVATPERLLFVGIEPRDKLSGEDAPPAIITSEFPNDTLANLDIRRVYTLTAHGVVIKRAARQEEYAAARGHDAELDSLAAYVDAQHLTQRRTAANDRELRRQVAEVMRRPLHYVVKRGDALSSIARRFGATPDQVKEWNHMTNDRVRIGAKLLVKPAG